MMQPEVRAILAKALELVRRGWCQFTFARGTSGTYVHVSDPSACQWCVRGALWAARRELKADSDSEDRARNSIFLLTAPECISEWNDAPGRTQADVISLLERAIAGE